MLFPSSGLEIRDAILEMRDISSEIRDLSLKMRDGGVDMTYCLGEMRDGQAEMRYRNHSGGEGGGAHPGLTQLTEVAIHSAVRKSGLYSKYWVYPCIGNSRQEQLGLLKRSASADRARPDCAEDRKMPRRLTKPNPHLPVFCDQQRPAVGPALLDGVERGAPCAPLPNRGTEPGPVLSDIDPIEPIRAYRSY